MRIVTTIALDTIKEAGLTVPVDGRAVHSKIMLSVEVSDRLFVEINVLRAMSVLWTGLLCLRSMFSMQDESAGYTAKDFVNWLMESSHNAQNEKSRKRIADEREDEVRFGSQSNLAAVIGKYYKQLLPGDRWFQYEYQAEGYRKLTTVFTTKALLDMEIDLSDEDSGIVIRTPRKTSLPSSDLDPEMLRLFKDYGKLKLEQQIQRGTTLFSNPTFVVENISFEKRLSEIGFGLVDFLKYRFTSGLLGDELTESLVRSKGNIDAIVNEPLTFLPIRSRLMSTRSALDNFSSRYCAAGVNAFVAIRRGKPYDDFGIPVHLRSQKVATGSNKWSLTPQAYHQQLMNSKREAYLQLTVFRELFEEGFGGDSVEREHNNLDPQWYMHQHPGMRWFREFAGAYDLKLQNLTINSYAGNVDFGCSLIIPVEAYWQEFGSLLEKNWEASKMEVVSSLDHERWVDLLTESDWISESVPTLVSGLNYLSRRFPKRTRLPTVEFKAV
jgi:hypothetical protein